MPNSETPLSVLYDWIFKNKKSQSKHLAIKKSTDFQSVFSSCTSEFLIGILSVICVLGFILVIFVLLYLYESIFN